MVRQLVLLCGLLLAGVATAAPRKPLPDFIQVCKRSDARLDKCMVGAIETLRPRLKEGIPEMKVPPMEPLVIAELHITPDGGSLNALATNVQLFGVSDFVIDSLKVVVNETALIIQAAITIPKLPLAAEYKVDGKILSLPLHGRGPLTGEAKGVAAKLELIGQLHKRKSDTYLRFHDGEFKIIQIDSLKIHLQNLFNGDKTLGEATNSALNENQDELKRLIVPDVERTLTEFVINTANHVVAEHTWDQIMPSE